MKKKYSFLFICVLFWIEVSFFACWSDPFEWAHLHSYYLNFEGHPLLKYYSSVWMGLMGSGQSHKTYPEHKEPGKPSELKPQIDVSRITAGC